MANVFVQNSSLQAIADAIRDKLNTEDTYKPAEMASAIESISSGGSATLVEKSISANGTYNASSDSADGYSKVVVSVPASAVDTGTKNITANGTNQDVVGYAKVDVAVPNSYSAGDEGKVVSNGALVAQTSDTVTTNDTYDTTLINSLTVNVASGPSGYESGVFAPASDTQEIQVSVNGTYTHFAFAVIEAKADLTFKSNTAILGHVFSNGNGYVMDSNNGTNYSGFWRDSDGWRQYANFSSSTIKASFLGNGGRCYFAAGNTYRWIAW